MVILGMVHCWVGPQYQFFSEHNHTLTGCDFQCRVGFWPARWHQWKPKFKRPRGYGRRPTIRPKVAMPTTRAILHSWESLIFRFLHGPLFIRRQGMSVSQHAKSRQSAWWPEGHPPKSNRSSSCFPVGITMVLPHSVSDKPKYHIKLLSCIPSITLWLSHKNPITLDSLYRHSCWFNASGCIIYVAECQWMLWVYNLDTCLNDYHPLYWENI